MPNPKTKPQIARSETIRRWKGAINYDWEELTSPVCAFCTMPFSTGDVVLVFGDLDASIAIRRFGCRRCGLAAILTVEAARETVSGALVYVEPKDIRTKFENLPAAVQERVIEGFTTIDRLSDGVAAEGPS